MGLRSKATSSPFKVLELLLLAAQNERTLEVLVFLRKIWILGYIKADVPKSSNIALAGKFGIIY